MIFLPIWLEKHLIFFQKTLYLYQQKFFIMSKLIGRQNEIAQIKQIIASKKREFVAIYGRRRVGKTFLIRSLLSNSFNFEMTGTIDGSKEIQMFNFSQALIKYGIADANIKTWQEAFLLLSKLLHNNKKSKPTIVFIDELPCLDTPRSEFIKALDHFWNGLTADIHNLKLIVCGSATSWMVDNLIDNHGGLHNRITHEIHLEPFTLKETEEFLNSSSFKWNRLQIAQMYMMLGGIPYYLNLLNKNESTAQNIDRLFFHHNGELRNEYNRLYRSLFKNPEQYIRIVELLAKNKQGLTRDEIKNHLGLATGGTLSSILKNLVNCDFVRKYFVKDKKIKSKDGIYQLIDFFSLFHLTFNKNNKNDDNYWSHTLNTPTQNNWFGLAFERLAMAHIPQIKKALRIDGILTEFYSWRSKDKETKTKTQIDLIIDRADQMINLCEIKYSTGVYTITKNEETKLRNRISDFTTETRSKVGILLTLITPFGLKENIYSSGISAQVTLDDLFT